MIDELRWQYHSAVHGRWHDLRGHMTFLYETARARAEPVIIEAGVRTGMSTRAFLLGAEERHGQVWSVDTAPAQVPDVISDHPRWHFLQADDLSDQARDWLPGAIDVLFLDAHDDGWRESELFEHVLAELRAYMPRVRPDGVVLAHDTQWRPPDIDLGEPHGAVASALDAYRADSGLTWENRPGFYGLGVMRIPG